MREKNVRVKSKNGHSLAHFSILSRGNSKLKQKKNGFLEVPLRHLAATEVRRKHGLEAAQVLCGHKHASTTEIYAEVDHEKGIQVVREIG
jgi:site-specific recombinase XerC